MKVASIKIHNILGIEDFELTPKEITRFEGRNAVGKTSALEAIKAVLKGGHDATLLRNGTDKGEIVLLMDDGLEVKKIVTAEKTDLTMKYPRAGIKVDKPQTQLNALTDALSVNPIEFLTAPAKDRTAYLLQAMPLKVTVEDIKNLVPANMNPQALTQVHAFTALAAIDKALYDERTGVNRLKDEKIKTAKQLGETLPLDEEKTDWAAQVKEKTQALSDEKNDLKNAHEKIHQHDREVRQLILSQKKELTSAIQEEYSKRLRALDEWRFGELNKINEEEKTKNSDAEAWFKTHMEEASGPLNISINNLTGELSAAETNAKRQIKENATCETITRVLEEANRHEIDSDALTARLEALQALRLKILANLPIAGLTVTDGQIMKDGVIFDRLNTAQQVEIAVAIAKLRAKDLGIVTVDGLECLDQEHFEAFEAAMAGSGLQCFITRVTNTPMEVTTK